MNESFQFAAFPDTVEPESVTVPAEARPPPWGVMPVAWLPVTWMPNPWSEVPACAAPPWLAVFWTNADPFNTKLAAAYTAPPLPLVPT